MTFKRMEFEGPNGVAQRVILVDVNGDPYAASGGAGGAGSDREVIVSTYRVKTNGTGYSVGDTVTGTRVLDVTGATATQVGSTLWYNETTAAALAGPPTASHIVLVGAGALTDAELRATAVPVSATALPLPAGAATAAAQATLIGHVDGIETLIGTTNATLTTIDGRVDGLEAATGATADAAAAADGTGNYSLIAGLKRALLNWATLLGRVPAAITPGLLPVDTLGTVGTARTVAMGSASANVALTTTVRRVSIHATVAGFYAIGTSAQTASSSTHYIGAGERLDLDVPANAQIAAIRAASDGTLYITELV